MRTRQTALALKDLGSMGSGELLKIWLKGQGLNPDGKIMRHNKTIEDEEYAIYTEVLEQ